MRENNSMHHATRPRLLVALVTALLMLQGCRTATPVIPAPLEPARRPAATATATEQPAAKPAAPSAETPAVPRFDPTVKGPLAPTQPPSDEGPANITLNFEQLPLPTFIQIVYGDILKKNVNLDPQVLSRQDLVTIRSGGMQTARQIEDAAVKLLKSYGLSVVDVGGLVRVVPDNASLGQMPEILRGTTLPTTPLPLRPIFYLTDLQSIRQTEAAGMLKQMFGNRINIQEDAGRNALLLSGTPDNLKAVLDAIRILDQPVMRGRTAVRIMPSYWSADDLAKRLTEILTAEGYAMPSAGTAPAAGVRYPVLLLPISNINTLFAFTQSDVIADHIRRWAATLDQPNERALGKNFFTYVAQNTSATALAATLEQLLAARASAATASATPTAAGGSTSTAASGSNRSTDSRSSASRGGRVVVDRATNTLIMQADADEYPQLLSIIKSIDRPSKQALIEVTVAELTLTDDFQLGVEWLLNTIRPGSPDGVTVGTLGGLALGTGGFSYNRVFSGGDRQIILNALATNNRSTILSSPRIMARNGEKANIQVGQQVPIITSQQTSLAGQTNNSGLGVLQSIQYRDTGVILDVTPNIYGGDELDLEIAQEVSAAQSTTTGVNNSPTIATRKVSTRLSLRNGNTILLGGLISGDNSGGMTGLPGLKDIPVLGYLFGKETQRKTKTELIVLITPYVINDDFDARAVTDAFRQRLGDWAAALNAPSAAPGANGSTIPPSSEAPPATSPAPAPAQTPANRETPVAPPTEAGASR